MVVDLHLGDCLDELKKIPSESIDLVLTDPAYESMMKWAGIGTTARMGMGKKGSGSDDLNGKWFDIFPNENLPDLVQEIHRVLKPERHAYIMSDWETLKLLHNFAINERVFLPQKVQTVEVEPFKPLIIVTDEDEDEPFSLISPREAIADILLKFWKNCNECYMGDWNYEETSMYWADWFLEHLYNLSFNQGHDVLIWDKVLAGTGYTYRTVHEYILFLWKGRKRKLNNLGIPDVLRYPKPWGNERIFPTQKSLALMETLIGQSTQEGEIVLDMFLGSGTTGLAAVRTNRNFIGIEKNPETLEMARKKIENAIAIRQEELPL